jgi:hypothetical protein
MTLLEFRTEDVSEVISKIVLHSYLLLRHTLPNKHQRNIPTSVIENVTNVMAEMGIILKITDVISALTITPRHTQTLSRVASYITI